MKSLKRIILDLWTAIKAGGHLEYEVEMKNDLHEYCLNERSEKQYEILSTEYIIKVVIHK